MDTNTAKNIRIKLTEKKDKNLLDRFYKNLTVRIDDLTNKQKKICSCIDEIIQKLEDC